MPAGQDDGVPLVQQGQGRRPANPRAGAGHQRDLAVGHDGTAFVREQTAPLCAMLRSVARSFGLK